MGTVVVLGAIAAPAQAATSQPLGQYVVSGRVDADALARAGYDLTESGAGKRKGYSIVATPDQAAALAAKGVRVRALSRGARTASARARSAQAALPNPTKGYDVFRPWSLQPAACPTTCSTPLKPLKQIWHELAAANPDVVSERVIGRSVRGQAIMAYKVTRNARRVRDGRRPAVLYDATQHAREWITAEVQRRLFAYVLAHKDEGGRDGVGRILDTRELWFVPVDNPDGYDYTFTAATTRLWRKNLRDNNGDGVLTEQDGVDLNRNWPEKWNYDLEGSSDKLDSETYHGTGPASEPEVQAIRGLIRHVRPKFMIDYHSFAQLILWPEGWQVETPATDAPLMEALAGDDDRPAVAGFDPDVSAELYTTNGDITGDAYNAFGSLAYTIELDGGAGDPAGGTDGSDAAYTPGGFVFQDSEAAVQAQFAKNIPFALDLARSAGRPDRPSSHLGNTAPDFVPTTFPTSFGAPQAVEVNAKRSLGRVRVRYQVNGGRVRTTRTREYKGGERYGRPGVYYHRLRGVVRGFEPGDTVKVWFTAGGKRSAASTFDAVSDTGNRVLLMVAEDYTGNSPEPSDGPRYAAAHAAALTAAGVRFDTYDVDARGRLAPSALGVLSHYDAVVWETGDDLYVREPEQPGGTGVSKLLDDEIINARDYMNEGGKLVVGGQAALQGAWDELLYNPLGRTPPKPFCATNQTTGQGGVLGDDPPGQAFNCVITSNDFLQYWLGAYQVLPKAATAAEASALHLQEVPPLGSAAFTLNGADSAANQATVNSFLTTSSILKPDVYPQFTSDRAVKLDTPPAYDPPTGSRYAFSGTAASAYKRLTRTVDLSGAASGSLSFKLSRDTEADYDFVFVEARTAGGADWTTLPDANGHTSQDVGAGCADSDPFWLLENPFLGHYLTRTGSGDATACTPTGTSGAWNAASGSSSGFEDWDVDLSAYAGKQVEVSITYVTDPGTEGLGVFVDDTTVTAGGSVAATTSFEDGLGGWSVPGAPEGSGVNAEDWVSTTSVGYVDGPGVRTPHSVLLGFGAEGVTGAAPRAQLLGDALRALGVR